MLIIRNPKTQLPMDVVVSKGYPYGLGTIDTDSVAVHDGKEFVAELNFSIPAGSDKWILFIPPIGSMGFVEIRDIKIESYQSDGSSRVVFEAYENVTTSTETGDTMGFNMDRSSNATCNSLIHSDPATITGGTKLPVTFSTIRSSAFISIASIANRSFGFRMNPSTKYGFKLTNTDATYAATVTMRIVFIEAL